MVTEFRVIFYIGSVLDRKLKTNDVFYLEIKNSLYILQI